MKREDDQELWDLLGKASPPPTVSPFFARDVLREIRLRLTWRDRLGPWLTPRRLIPTATVAAVVIAGGLSLQRVPVSAVAPDDLPEVVAQLDPADFEVVADLDNLLAWEEDNLWTDNDVSAL